MRIGMLQLNPVVGNIAGNTDRIIEAIHSIDADLIVTPEMSICGYPPRDLLLVHGFVQTCEDAVQRVMQASTHCTVLVCHPRIDAVTGRIRNSASILSHGKLIATVDKKLLPSYDVFDEKRYFEEGDSPCLFTLDGVTIGVAICEDFWRGFDANAAPTYDINPMIASIEGGCDMIISPSASPFVTGKRAAHLQYALELAKKHAITIVVNNQVGGNDDLVFDGGSFVVNERGLLGESPLFKTCHVVIDIGDAQSVPIESSEILADEERFRALVLGTKDYFHKTGHQSAILGLSGGIDSALVATIAVTALGKQHVTGVMLPSRYSSLGSIEDAEQLASQLGISTTTLSIEHMHAAFERTLHDRRLSSDGIVDENAQARIRGLLLMAMSNESGSLLLATGNKSELAVGYSTLYGDMDGALSVIGDLYKTDVWSMSHWLNNNWLQCGFSAPPIPAASITKQPSAELRPDQCDQDALPTYDVLDSILQLLIDFEWSIEEIQDELDLDDELIENIVRMVDIAEYKREQAAVILKISPRTFGRGRRLPIVMKRSWASIRETT